MMKKPTTKKLPEKQVARTVTAKGKPFMKLFSDEKFYQYPRYTNVFVSQYGNVISTTGTVPHLLTPHQNQSRKGKITMTFYTITDRVKEDMQWLNDTKEFPLDYSKC